jgi:hypothetical protein
MALLEEGNPAPQLGEEAWTDLDAATYLADLEQRINEMTQVETTESRQDPTERSRRSWLVAAAVFVVVLGVGVIVFNQMSPTDVAPPSGIPLEDAEEHPGAAEAFTAVEEAYALHNSGDPAWVEIRDRGSFHATPEAREAMIAEGVESFPAYEARTDVSRCVAQGFGEWPGTVDAGVPTPTGHHFLCYATYSDALLAIAGVSEAATERWVVDDGAVVAVNGSYDWSDSDAFVASFEEWLRTAHPEAVELPGLFLDGGVDGEAKDQLLEYAEEFVAESDVYPLESTD